MSRRQPHTLHAWLHPGAQQDHGKTSRSGAVINGEVTMLLAMPTLLGDAALEGTRESDNYRAPLRLAYSNTTRVDTTQLERKPFITGSTIIVGNVTLYSKIHGRYV